MGNVLRIGLAGIGSVSRQVLPELETAENVKLTAVADVRQEALDFCSQRYGCETYTSVEDMSASPNVDAVWICTPNMYHAEHTIIAAEHGKHVICEKPMAVTLDQAREMVAVVERNGVRYVQGHSRVFDAPIRKMREIVSEGDLGRVIQINTWEFKPWLSGQPRLPSELDFSIGGGVLYRQGPHQIDIVRGIGGGMVKSVRAITGRWDPAFPDAEGDYTAFLEFEDGTAATMIFNGYGYFDISELTFGLGEARHLVDGRPQQEHRRQAASTEEKYAFAAARGENERRVRAEGGRRHQPFFGLTVVSCERGDLRQSPDGIFRYTEEGRDELPVDPRIHGRGELGELRDALAEDRPSFPNQRWGQASLEVALAIRQSSIERREIPLSLQVPVPF
jgi:phthalate 4,5-cis-dihydrodiol dehydrogenase